MKTLETEIEEIFNNWCYGTNSDKACGLMEIQDLVRSHVWAQSYAKENADSEVEQLRQECIDFVQKIESLSKMLERANRVLDKVGAEPMVKEINELLKNL